MLPDGPDSEAEWRFEKHDPREGNQRQCNPDHQIELSEDGTEEGHAVEETEVDLRDRRDVRRCSLLAEDVDEEVPREPEGEEVDRRAADDLVCAQVNRQHGMQ